MALVPLHGMLQDARRGGYAVGAFNVVNLEFLEAIIETAETKRSPVILSIAEAHFPYVNLDNVCPLIVDTARRSAAPVALHLDHGVSDGAFLQAVRHGFTSVMFDGSKLSFEDNVAKTRQVIEICRPLGISVEAELGAVGGDEGDALGGLADPSLFTDPPLAKTFVEQTGVDALAVAIGNVHGKYRGEPQLDFARLERINELCGVPLVLHGGSGISEADFRRAISLGIAKINFYTGMSQAALAAASAFLTDGRRSDYPLLMQAMKRAVAETVAEQMRVFGSVGKAV